MVKNYSLILDNEFVQYCKLNNIEDVEKMALEVFNKGFNILKYGEKPNHNSAQKKIIEEPKIIPKETSLYDE
jgi:hypothetical protein